MVNSCSYWLKRVVAMITLVVMVTTLFSFAVFADDTWIRGTVRYNNTAGSLAYNATACMLNYNTETTMYGGIYAPVLITASLYNQTSQDIYVSSATLLLDFSGYAWVSGYDNFSSDLILVPTNTDGSQHQVTYYLKSDNGFSYNSGFVVPANSALYLVTQINVYAEYNAQSADISSVSLDGISLNISPNDVTSGSYPTSRDPVDLSQVETLLNTINSALVGFYNLFAQEQNDTQALISAQNALITAIKDQIITTHTFSLDRLTNTAVANAFSWTTVNDKEYRVYYRVSQLVPVSTAVSIDGVTGNELQYNTYKAHVQVTVYFRGSGVIYFNYINLFPYRFGSSPIAIDNITVTSTFADYYYPSTNGTQLNITGKYPRTPSTFYIPSGHQYIVLNYDMYYDSTQNVTITAPDAETRLFAGSFGLSTTGVDFISDDNYILNLIYQGLQSNNSSDVSSSSNSLKQSETTAHQQEQSYFAQNTQAIQATGLSNYRFDTVQQNGINAVSIDFTQLWNALGAWNSVYIFSLTLTLSLTILRHAPNAISRRMRKKQE